MSNLNDRNEFRVQLWTDALGVYQTSYAAMSETWNKMDDKAGSTVTIAGMFLAAILAIARVRKVGDQPDGERGMFAIAVIFLVAAVVTAIISVRPRPAEVGPTGLDVERAASRLEELVPQESELPDLRVRFLRTQVNRWRVASGGFKESLRKKTVLVRTSQYLLYLGSLVAVAVTLRSL